MHFQWKLQTWNTSSWKILMWSIQTEEFYCTVDIQKVNFTEIKLVDWLLQINLSHNNQDFLCHLENTESPFSLSVTSLRTSQWNLFHGVTRKLILSHTSMRLRFQSLPYTRVIWFSTPPPLCEQKYSFAWTTPRHTEDQEIWQEETTEMNLLMNEISGSWL